MKDFDGWIIQKKTLDGRSSGPPFISEGDIWWVGFGENVGGEICGKSDIFTRPAIIFKKFSRQLYFVIPTTTKEKVGTWYVALERKGVAMFACLHQARTIDYRRVWSKVGALDEAEQARVRNGFNVLYK